MNSNSIRPTDAPPVQREAERFAGGSGPVVDYVALPEEPTETVAIAGPANTDLTAAEAGGFDGDD